MSAVEQYVVILVNEKLSTHKKLGLAFVIANAVIFILFLFLKKTLAAGIIGLAAILGYYIYRKTNKKSEPLYLLMDEKIFYLLTIAWFFQNVFIAIFVLITGLLLKFAIQPFRFVFSREGIVRDFFPKKLYPWNDMSTVILKDGILTLDFKDNRLLQLPVENVDGIDVVAFNAFTQGQLSEISPDANRIA